MAAINRRGAFLAEHLRQPNADEEREIKRLEREDRRQEAAQRRETNLKRAYLGANPGADDAQWEREKSGILQADRAERTKAAQDAARAGQASMLRNTF